eukprot:CCRYP_020972-RA/>CCRYP_020972-RA protein AED:0.44 eAED:0.92 QI:12/0/0.5/1/0/0/2/0/72
MSQKYNNSLYYLSGSIKFGHDCTSKEVCADAAIHFARAWQQGAGYCNLMANHDQEGGRASLPRPEDVKWLAG